MILKNTKGKGKAKTHTHIQSSVNVDWCTPPKTFQRFVALKIEDSQNYEYHQNRRFLEESLVSTSIIFMKHTTTSHTCG